MANRHLSEADLLFLLGSAPGDRAVAEQREHLQFCLRCARDFSAVRQVVEALRATPTREVPQSLDARLQARLKGLYAGGSPEAGSGGGRARRCRGALLTRAAAAAVALGGCIGAALHLWRLATHHPPAAPARQLSAPHASAMPAPARPATSSSGVAVRPARSPSSARPALLAAPSRGSRAPRRATLALPGGPGHASMAMRPMGYGEIRVTLAEAHPVSGQPQLLDGFETARPGGPAAVIGDGELVSHGTTVRTGDADRVLRKWPDGVQLLPSFDTRAGAPGRHGCEPLLCAAGHSALGRGADRGAARAHGRMSPAARGGPRERRAGHPERLARRGGFIGRGGSGRDSRGRGGWLGMGRAAEPGACARRLRRPAPFPRWPDAPGVRSRRVFRRMA